MIQLQECLANGPVGTVEDNSVIMGEERKKERKEKKNERGTKDEKDQHGNKDSE